MTISSTSQMQEDSAGSLSLTAAASLLGVLLVASIGVALVIEETERGTPHTLPTVIVQRVFTIEPGMALPVGGSTAAAEPVALAAEDLVAIPAKEDEVAPVEGKETSTASGKAAPEKAKPILAERAEDADSGEVPETIAEEPRRTGGGSGNALGYDYWSPLLDGSIGIRETPESDSEVARIREPRRGLRPFSDANHG